VADRIRAAQDDEAAAGWPPERVRVRVRVRVRQLAADHADPGDRSDPHYLT